MSLENQRHPCATGETCQTAVLAGTSVQLQVCIRAASTADASTDAAPTDRGSPSDAEHAATDGGADGPS